MTKKPEVFSFQELGELALDGLSRARTRPTVHGYVPHGKQIQFHSASEKGRLYIGGNRSGKTVGGVVEDIWWLRGQHPYRRMIAQPPIRGRIVTVSYIEGIQKIIIPEITKWIPPSDLINGSWEDSYSKAERTLTLTNGSSVELMSYDQKLEKFAGTSRHFVHFDEEPPKDIFGECKLRLLDTGGSWWMTMTPVEGMTWVYDDLYEPGLVPGSNIAVIIIDTEENPYVTKAEIEFALEGLGDAERKARKEGKFVQLGGLAFPEFGEAHIIDPLDEDKLRVILPWTQYASLDHGLNNPTAWLYHAVAPSGSVVTFDEIYDNNKLVNDFAALLHTRNAEKFRRPPDVYVGDPAIKQRNGQTGDSIQTAYARAGIPIALGNNDVAIGIDKMSRYLRTGKWVITSNCQNLIREMMRLRWKIYETAKMRQANNARPELHKKDDHAPDSARYFFSMMPDLYIPKEKDGRTERINKVVHDIINPRTTPVGPGYIDHNLLQPQSITTEWTSVDEHMGGYF